MVVVAGRLLGPDEVLQGYVEVDEGRVVGWGEGAPPERPAATGWVTPAPVNAHTHVVDAFLRDVPGKPSTVHELVGPGGWKHRHLQAAVADQLEAGVRRYVQEMAAWGTSAFLDFREGGLAGVHTLRAITDLPVEPRIFGRPLTPGFDAAEAELLLPAVDGIGLSALRDFKRRPDAEAWAEAAHKARKPFALHASEARHEPMEPVLALDPAFIVHATQARPRELAAAADQGTLAVVCPRSNAHYGMKTPLPAMLDAGLTVAVGTDNGMLNDGDLLAELAQLAAWHPGVPIEQLLRLATWNARAVAGMRPRWPPRPGDAADLVVLPERPLAPTASHKPGFAVHA